MKQVEIITPEGVPISFELGTRFERALAFCVDIALVCLLTIVLSILFVVMTLINFSDGAALLMLGIFVVRQGYFVLFESAWSGSTPGKRLLSLRVVSRFGGALQVRSVIARNLTRDLELFLPLVAVLAPVALVGEISWWMSMLCLSWLVVISALPFFTSEWSRAGDLIAGTLVIRIPTAPLLVDEAQRSSLLPITFSRAQLSIYGETELETLSRLLRDASEGRAEESDLRLIAQTIARKILYKSNEPEVSPLYFLRTFYKQQRMVLEKRRLKKKKKSSKADQ